MNGGVREREWEGRRIGGRSILGLETGVGSVEVMRMRELEWEWEHERERENERISYRKKNIIDHSIFSYPFGQIL